MGQITDKFVSSFSELYYKNANMTAAEVTDPFDWFAGATKVPLVGEIGSLSNEATIIDVPEFGQKYKGKLRGQLDAGQLDVSLFWAPRDATHLALRTLAENGDKASFGIKWITDLNGGDNEYVVFNAYVASFGIDTTFDDVAKASLTVAIDGALNFDDADG